jgi:hypothetical protein
MAGGESIGGQRRTNVSMRTLKIHRVRPNQISSNYEKF